MDDNMDNLIKSIKEGKDYKDSNDESENKGPSTQELVSNLTYDDVYEHIYFKLLNSLYDDTKTIFETCPHFQKCGFDAAFIVDLSEIFKGEERVAFITTELAEKWLGKTGDDLMAELMYTADVNLDLKSKKFKIVKHLDNKDEKEAVSMYDFTVNGMVAHGAYTNSYVIEDRFLNKMYDQLGDFYIFPRFSSRFYIIGASDLANHDREPLETYYTILLNKKIAQMPLFYIFSEKTIFCDGDSIQTYTC